MAENNNTNENRSITQIQASDSIIYDLNAKYWNGKPFNDFTIDEQSIYDGGSISIFKKYQQVDEEHSFPNILIPNTKYIFKNPITSLDFTSNGFGWGNDGYIYCEYTFIFKCDEQTNATITENGWYWADGAKPSLESGMRYELSVSVINTDGAEGNIVHAILVPFYQLNN